MKFKAEPNLYVKLNNKYVKRVTGLKGFYFDSEGIYETENETMIKVLSQNFEIVEVKEKINLEKSVKVSQGEEIKLKHCKKCEFTCTNQGELLKHYKVEHPKGES